MQVAIQQPEHLPWAGFFDKMARCDLFIYLDNVQYKKRYFENRNKIRTRDGWAWVTVPVISKGHYTQWINEVRIDNRSNWKRKYLGSVRAAYGKTPHFKSVYPAVEAVLAKEYDKLLDLNLALIEMVRSLSGVTTPCRLASDILPDTPAVGSDLIFELCRKCGATTYVSGPDGGSYLQAENFENAGIELVFHEYVHPEYVQIPGGFEPYMSVIDALFNTGDRP